MEERAFKVTVSSVVAVKKEESEVDGPKTSSGPKPLKHMDFFLVGRLKRDKESLKRDILLLGGHVSSKLHQDVVAVISTENDVKKMSSKVPFEKILKDISRRFYFMRINVILF